MANDKANQWSRVNRNHKMYDQYPAQEPPRPPKPNGPKGRHISHLASILSQGGIGFVIIKFTSLNENYVYPASELIQQWQHLNGKQSISYQEIVDKSFVVPESLNPSLDYLTAVDKMLEALH